VSKAKFIQIHYLTPYHTSLLNRDDAGLAKRIPFGGVSRIRISSQCLKRHWRTFRGSNSLESIADEIDGLDMSVRSRRIFEQQTASPLVDEGYDRDVVYTIIEQLSDKVLGVNAQRRAQTSQGSEEINIETKQLIVLGRPEIDYMKNLVREVAQEAKSAKEAKKKCTDLFKNKDLKKDFKALVYAAGLDAALFGRMVTSDILARGDAAIHVAHAFTVHSEETETDYFTAVDDLAQASGELGSGHLNETELTSGLYYGYVVVDVPQLISNLEGVSRENWTHSDATLASRVVRNLIHIIATVSPGAKQGSTAPYSRANTILVETGEAQPRSLANAFLFPVSSADAVSGSIKAMKTHLVELDRMYGKQEERRVVSLEKIEDDFPAEKTGSLDEIAEWAADQLLETG